MFDRINGDQAVAADAGRKICLPLKTGFIFQHFGYIIIYVSGVPEQTKTHLRTEDDTEKAD